MRRALSRRMTDPSRVMAPWAWCCCLGTDHRPKPEAADINSKSPTAIKMLKYGMNLPDEGLVGQQLFAGEATRLAYGTDEAKEGRDAFVQKRKRNFSKVPWSY